MQQQLYEQALYRITWQFIQWGQEPDAVTTGPVRISSCVKVLLFDGEGRGLMGTIYTCHEATWN